MSEYDFTAKSVVCPECQIALQYARDLHYSIIPIEASSKKPLVYWAVHQRFRANEALIRNWFRRFPDMSVGIVTGAVSGLTVVDFDSLEAYQDAQQRGWSVTPTERTRRGFHAFFQDTGLRNRIHLLPGVDIRGEGGAVVVYPSPNREWIDSPFDVPLAVLPTWLMEYANQPEPDIPQIEQNINDYITNSTGLLSGGSHYGQAVLANCKTALLNTAPGERNDAFFAAMLKILGLELSGELPSGMADEQLPPIALLIGLSEVEVERSRRSAHKYARPWSRQ